MARRGRKRKMCKRYPNGQPHKESQVQKERAMRSVVLEQPHRLGSDEQMLENCVGRLIFQCWGEWGAKEWAWSMRELYDAAQKYADAYAEAQKVMGSRRPLANETRRSSGGTRAEEEISEWADATLKKWTAVNGVIGGPDSLYRKAAEIVILDNPGPDWTAPYWVKHGMIHVLTSLAEHYARGNRKMLWRAA
jgi:hypothetical protein